MNKHKFNQSKVMPLLFTLFCLSACEKTDVPVKSFKTVSASYMSEPQSSIKIENISPSFGKVGQEIAIYGTGLSNKDDQFDTTAVFIRGVRIKPKYITPEKLVFVVPPSAPSGFVSIKVADDTLKSSFSFIAE